MQTFQVNHLLDTSGLYCPEPIMLLHQQLNKAQAQEIILVVVTDPATSRDLPKLCQFLGHKLLQVEENTAAGSWNFWIEKG